MKSEVGVVVKGLGGLYEILVGEGRDAHVITCRAKGNLKRDDEKVLIGDKVTVNIDETTPDSTVISSVAPRLNSLIRPPIANINILFCAFSATKPAPALDTVDKLIAIAEYNSIEPVIVITKADLDRAEADRLANIYKTAGFTVFLTSSFAGEGVAPIKAYLKEHLTSGVIAAFGGASGVGKSTLLNTLFPELGLGTAEISKKIERGRHTTRAVELYRTDVGDGFLADTPGFSLLDFERFDFFSLDDLQNTFRDVAPYTGKCRYADCSHTGEGPNDCAVAAAVRDGKIAESRLASYRSIYAVLKNKPTYK